jgi:hypothetical protein
MALVAIKHVWRMSRRRLQTEFLNLMCMELNLNNLRMAGPCADASTTG